MTTHPMLAAMAGASPFTGARKARPTTKHRPAIWECMLGTVYAMNDARECRYFDYDWAAAREFAGVDRPDADLRLARIPKRGLGVRHIARGVDYAEPRRGQMVLWTRDNRG